MSLQVWLPLNGNIENLGICGDITSTSTPEYTVGKLEKGISLNKRVDFTGLPKLTNFSIFFWARVDSCTTSWSDLLGFTCKQSNDASAAEFRFEATAETRACSWHNNSPFGISSGTRILIQNYEEWHHVGVVYDGENIYSYIDGELTYTDTGLGGYLITNFHIGETGKFVGAMNDLRIYDTVLSKLEIKEISKGLVCHLPMSHCGMGNFNMLDGTTTWSDWFDKAVVSIDEDTGICSINSSGSYPKYQPVNVEIGEEYTISVETRADESFTATNGILLFDYFDSNNARVTSRWGTGNFSTEWEHKQWTITVPEDTKIKKLSVGIRATDGKIVYFKKLKVEKGNVFTGWNCSANDMKINELVEYDTSGFGLNGILSKQLLYTTDSAIGQYSLDLTGTDYESYIRVADYPQLEKDFTWNAWVKQSDKTLPKTLQTILSQGRDYTGNTTNGADCGFNMFISNGIPEIRYGNWTSSKNGNILLSAGEALDDQWHMITASIDSNGIGRIYIDGKLKKTATTSTTCAYSQATGNLVIGKMSYQYTSTNQFFPLNGLIDDIKLFACTLSDDDIERMYNTKMFIDKNGVISGNSFTELRQNSFYFNIDNMNGSNNSVLEVVDCTAKSIRLKFKQAPNTWQGKYFPLEDFIQDGKTYTVYMRPNKDCNKNLADGVDNQYGRTYGIIGVHRYKISDNSVVKLEWQLKEIKTYIGRFTVDYTTYKNYQLRLYPNCTDTTSWNNGDYIYDYVDIVPEEEDYNTNISKQSCFTTGEFLEDESNNKPQIEKYNRTKINKLTEI